MNNSRVLLVLSLVFVCFILLGLKLFTIQITNHNFYAEIAERQQNKSFKLKAERGVVKDRNGEVLAYTKNDISLFVDKRMLNDSEKDSVANVMSRVFKKSKKHYLNLIASGKNNICLEKKISKESMFQFENFYVDGFFVQEDFSRIYPYGSLCSHLLGYVDGGNGGVYGVEKQYDEYLTGKEGIKFIENDVLGRTVSVKTDNSKKPIPGNVVQLTINKTYQTILEQELLKGMQEFKGDSASGIIMNPKTGEVLALSSLPDFDPSNHGKFDLKFKRNRALTDPYEPGSIIKPVVMSMLLEKKLAREDEVINTENGTYNFKTTKIRDTHSFDHLTVRGVLEQSSNIGMAKLSQRLDENTFYKYMRDFGFGNTTSIDLPGESNGFLKKPKQFSQLSKPFMSFGYEFSATPIQMAVAYSALVNGGHIMRPYVVKEIRDQLGNIVIKNEPKKIRDVINKSTSDKMIDFMIGVIEEGTATKAKLSNVLIGGKTGTSQMLIKGSYSKNQYNASFVGFFPAEDPQIVCLITVSSPEIGRYGGQVSAPIFKAIAEKIIDADLSVVPAEQKIERRKEYLDDLLKKSDAGSQKNVLKFSNIGQEQTKSRETKVLAKDRMPELLNLALRDATVVLNEIGIKYKIIGTGKVLSQSIPANQKIDQGSFCLIRCETKRMTDLRLN